MNKKIIISIVSLAVIVIVVFVGISLMGRKREKLNLSATTGEAVTTNGAATEDKSVEQIIRENAEEMKRRVVDHGSGNPFDYMDQECMDNIVALGFDAIDVLDNEHSAGGLDLYTAGVVILEITGCDLGSWDSASRFRQLWVDFVTMAPQELSFIITSDGMDVDDKLEKIKPYGIFGEAFVKDILEKGEETRLFCDVGSKLNLSDEEKEKLAAMITYEESELEKACQYLVDKNND